MKRRNRIDDTPPEVTLPVTPMLDLAFQLLFFFICNFNPAREKEGQMPLGDVDTKTEAPAQVQQNVDLKSESHKKETPEVKAELTIVLHCHNDEENKGKISGIEVRDKAGDRYLEPPRTATDREKARLDMLQEKLSKARTSKEEGKKDTVRLSADEFVPWQKVVEVMDICEKSGFLVSFAQPGF